MKTGKVTQITTGKKGRFIDIQVRNGNTVDVYSVRTDAPVKRGEVVVVPKGAKLVESFFV